MVVRVFGQRPASVGHTPASGFRSALPYWIFRTVSDGMASTGMLPSAASLAACSAFRLDAVSAASAMPASTTRPSNSSKTAVSGFFFRYCICSTPLLAAAQQDHNGTCRQHRSGQNDDKGQAQRHRGGVGHFQRGCLQRLGFDEGRALLKGQRGGAGLQEVTLPGST